MTRAWLADFGWNSVVEINQALCEQKHALHRATSDWYEETQKCWEDSFLKEMTLNEAVALCLACPRLAPFCNYNGNTFVAIIRNVINNIPTFTKEEQALARSWAGHIVAGTEQPEENRAFRELITKLENR